MAKKRKRRQCNIKPLSLVEIIQKIKTGMDPVMVQFKAEWCGACQATTPELKTAACDIQSDMEVVQVDVDEFPMVAAEFGVENLPTVAIIQHGMIQKRSEGSNTAAHFKKMARDWLKENGFKG